MNLRKLRWRRWALIAAFLAYIGYGFWLGAYRPIRNDLWCWAVWHVHSTMSDGIGDLPTIARAARIEGISTIILTDHSRSSPSSFNLCDTIQGVTIFRGGEIALPEGRLGVFDCLPTDTDGHVPLGRPPDDPPAAIDDIHRVGGIVVEMYGGDPRFAMQYNASDYRPDMIEYTNAMTLVRQMTTWEKCQTILFGFFTPFYWMSHWKCPSEALQRWDHMMGRGQTIHAMPAPDVHGGFRLKSITIPKPSYHDGLVLFGLGRPKGEPFTPATLRNGQFFSCTRGAGDPAQFSFRALHPHGNTNGCLWSGRLPPGTHPTFIASAGHSIYRTRIRLFRNGLCIKTTTQDRLTLPFAPDGVYRVVVTLDDHPFLPSNYPWILSNAIHVGGPVLGAITDETAPQPVNTQEKAANLTPIDRRVFTVNPDTRNSTTLVHRDTESDIQYHLGPFEDQSTMAAIGTSGFWKTDLFSGIAITATSDQDIRGSLIVYSGTKQWRASVHLLAQKTVRCHLPWHRFFLYDHKQTRADRPPNDINRILFTVDPDTIDRSIRGHYRLHDLSFIHLGK